MLGRTPGVLGRLLAAEDCHSVLVFGPTGSYKTSALVIPAVLEWTGPLLATSVKPDLLRATMAHRARLGQGIQLVIVWHDKSQLEARYGTKAATILNNHRAKLFLSGLADLSALELGARLIGDQALTERNRSMGSDGRHALNESTSYRPLLPVEDLRRLRPGRGCCCTATCARRRSGCGPSTPPASSTGGSVRRHGRRGG
jgi:type IV secretory pathway TraG/TraD family ATPase VirD4